MPWGLLGIAAAGALYLAVCQWLMTEYPSSPWAAAVVCGPMLVTAAVVGWRRGRGGARAMAAVAGLVAVGLVAQASRGGALAVETVYLVQNVSILGALALAFGSTLANGRTPFIQALASRVHPHGLTPDMAVYTRKVTVAWTAWFGFMASVSVLLYAFAPFHAWATFANAGTPLAMIGFFVGEHVMRYRWHPEFERASLVDAVRAYREKQAAAHRGGPD
jgi:uncharacterized membrane protein